MCIRDRVKRGAWVKGAQEREQVFPFSHNPKKLCKSLAKRTPKQKERHFFLSLKAQKNCLAKLATARAIRTAIIPVSYTHLDVYKRQLMAPMLTSPTRSLRRSECTIGRAVTYRVMLVRRADHVL